MRLLLDTQSLLWWINDDPRLGPRARSLIANPLNEVLVSAVTFWEMSIKVRIGKLDDRGSDVMREVQDSHFEIVQIEAQHLEKLEQLEAKAGHKDPFDHLILVQAIEREAILVTSDRSLKGYGVRCL